MALGHWHASKAAGVRYGAYFHLGKGSAHRKQRILLHDLFPMKRRRSTRKPEFLQGCKQHFVGKNSPDSVFRPLLASDRLRSRVDR